MVFAVGRVIQLPPVEVKENDVCVKMLAAPINPSDINRIEGFFLSFSLPFSFWVLPHLVYCSITIRLVA